MKRTEKTEMGAIQARLEDWLRSKIPNAKNLTMSPLMSPSQGGGEGFSSDTNFVDVRWEEDGIQKVDKLVFRWRSENFLFPEYKGSNLEKQYRVMKCLENSGLPVPKMCWFEEDARVLGRPFYVMSRVEGEVPPTAYPGIFGKGLLFDASPERRTALWQRAIEAMAKLHSLDWKGLGLSFLGAPDPGGNPFDHEIAYWEYCLDWIGFEPAPVVLKALDWIKKNKYQPNRVSVCWGDARLGNIVYRNDQVAAVLDWELAQIGAPEADLVYISLSSESDAVILNKPRLEGMPGPDETVKYYEEVTQRKVENLEFHKIFQAFKTSVFVHLGIRTRAKLLQDTVPDFQNLKTNNFPCQRLEQLLGNVAG